MNLKSNMDKTYNVTRGCKSPRKEIYIFIDGNFGVVNM